VPTWINQSTSGSWLDPSRWTGGIPNALGAVANFITGSGSIGALSIQLPNLGSEITVGIINVDLRPGSVTYNFLANTSDPMGTLVFNNGAAFAEVNCYFDSSSASEIVRFWSGFAVRLDSSLQVNVDSTGLPDGFGIVRFDVPISGTGGITKIGGGYLVLGGINTFTGGITILGGGINSNNAALGSGVVALFNNATFSTHGSVVNMISTSSAETGTAGSGRIAAETGKTAILTGVLSHLSQGTLTFGSDLVLVAGTVVASFSSILENSVNSNFSIVTTLRMGNAYNAANLLNYPGVGTTSVIGVLDAAGFVTTISNLDLNNGTIRSSVGPLNLIVNDTVVISNTQNGTFEGTSGADQIVFNVQGEFNLSVAGFANWTAGTDSIVFNGSSAGNTITASNQRETINGNDGNDTIYAIGGIDTINGGSGNDTIILTDENDGSVINGGANSDTLRIANGDVSLGSLTGIEAVELVFGATLTLNSAQLEDGLDLFSMLSGNGTVRVNCEPGGGFVNARGMNVTGGSTIHFTVNGAGSADAVKIALGATGTINGGAGTDILVGGDLIDTINGGTEVDKIRGGGGSDLLSGGSGADVFKYRNVSDSALVNPDTITDFLSGTDRLNFARIDTNPGLAGDQAFTYIGTAAFNTNGVAKIRYTDLGADVRVEADVNGDGVADMHILLVGAGAGTLSAADFVL
jgi:autotransporter-associated beta strand protein